jgi:hypothetical protein
MKKIIRFLVLLGVIVVGLYLLMSVFMIFAVLAAAGGLILLYMRYFGKNKKVYTSAKGVTIDHMPNAEHESPKPLQDPSLILDSITSHPSGDKFIFVETSSASNHLTGSPQILYDEYQLEVIAYCEGPVAELPNVVEHLSELVNHPESDIQLRAKINRLLGELHEANNNPVLALEYYEKAILLDVKVGVKRKITKLQKVITS